MKSLFPLLLILIFNVGTVMPKTKNPLTSYQKKRNFSQTPEPAGKVKKKQSKKLIFVIHKHAARNMHYDVRLEINGVLTSWAIPKGPSTSTRVRHLAIPTEDHPMNYAKFEGVIPKGQYGAGPVMIWDTGTYTNIKKSDNKKVSMKECLKRGTIEVELHGKKLNGAYALIRTKAPGKTYWLLLKMRDAYANKAIPATIKERSAKSGRTMKEIAKDDVSGD